MVVLPTPARTATSSMVSPLMPFSAITSAAATRMTRSACVLRGLPRRGRLALRLSCSALPDDLTSATAWPDGDELPGPGSSGPIVADSGAPGPPSPEPAPPGPVLPDVLPPEPCPADPLSPRPLPDACS